jgi:hypothetical protein
MAFVDHEFALLSVGRRPTARSHERPVTAPATGRAKRSVPPTGKRQRWLPPRAPRAQSAPAFSAPVRRRQYRPGR